MKGCAALALLLSTWGCGSGSDGAAGPVSCSAFQPGATAPTVCIDVVGGTEKDVANNRDQCAQQGNTFALTLCPHAGAGGGCRQHYGDVAITTWYYSGSTADEIKRLCDGLAEVAAGSITIEFVAP